MNLTIKTVVKNSFFKALLATFLFVLTYIFYNIELIRENIEDIAFDIINKISIEKKPQDINSSKVLLFAFDDLYMKSNKLYDEQNQTNYGYLFPRDKISSFIQDLDEFVSDIESQNRPKALFIDYDFSFTSLPYGKKLSLEDQQLIEVLKQPRTYTIFLPKTSSYNFIEHSNDQQIQKLIKDNKLIFVSVSLLTSNDEVTRRYQLYKKFTDENKTKKYINIDIALWQLIHNHNPNLNKAKDIFTQNDIVKNRIFIKGYQDSLLEDECKVSNSYWQTLIKYSANCSFYDIIEEDFSNSILLLGGTHSQNDDNFDVLDIFSSSTKSGIELHANTLMTLLHLNAPLERLSLLKSSLLIFSCFFFIELIISTIFIQFKMYNTNIEFLIVLGLNTVIMILISIYLLKVYHLWFNWIIPLVLYEVIEVLGMIKQIPIFKKLYNKEYK